MTCSEDIGYENPPPVKCPCNDCEGLLKFDMFNGKKTLAFLDCDTCGHCCHVGIKQNELRHFDGPTKTCYENGCTDDCPVSAATRWP